MPAARRCGAPLITVLTDVMPSFPLLFHSSSAETIAWRDGTPVPVREFLGDVMRLAGALPAGGHVFNMCTDRYRFAVGLCATLVAGKISLLPSAHTPEAVRQLAAFAPDTFCLHDSAHCSVALPHFRFPLESGVDAGRGSVGSDISAEVPVPQIDAGQVMAYLFTSGSTGVPVPHGKKWGYLVRCLRTSAVRLGLTGMGACTLVGTVPPQHMYGFETTVLLALIGGVAFSNRQPFYPGDVAAELAALAQPRVLVTSPVHLRALMMSDQALPPVALTLSATAPLTQDLARTAEARLGAPLLEIYGSTESGQIATRRTALGDTWQLYPELRLEMRYGKGGGSDSSDSADDATVWVSGGHVETPVPMGDALELLGDGRFLLHGRKGDLINIAGKRTSLGYLNHQLNDVSGVVDGVFFMPEVASTADAASSVPAARSGSGSSAGATAGGAGHGEPVTRLLALVVAPDLTPADLQRALRERIDAAFMPRPLIFVASLPRNATGKLPRDVLTALVAQHAHPTRQTPHTRGAASGATTLGFTIAADHACIAGHFPGQPIVPGVVLLDHAIGAIGRALGRPLDASRLSSAKFLSPAAPGTPLDLAFETSASGTIRFTIRFTIRAGTRTVASGVLAAPASVEQALEEAVTS
jgi:acyl-coenzyme A synthetase/AMP-(fatty) acid ligase/3-hydroxymyristoyl/3-hydroxydecanoyl-(acyl carrier protein) dehydratase